MTFTNAIIIVIVLIIFRTVTNDVYLTQKFNLNIGNPNIYNLINDINTKLSEYLTCSYDNIKNKITYIRTYIQSVNISTCLYNL